MSASTKVIQAAAGAGDAGGWDISTAQWLAEDVNYLYIGSEDTDPEGMFFKSDGLKMYICGQVNDSVYEYDLSTAWDVSSASFLQELDISSQDTSPAGLFFKPDGAKMYIVGNGDNDIIEYDLSTAWDISSASFNQNFDVSSQDDFPTNIFFKPDGTRMYICGSRNDSVYEYNLSTAWDISSASYQRNFSVSSQDAAPNGLFFKSDGAKMYVSGNSGDAIYEYNLSTAWNVSSASFLQSFSISQDSTPQSVFFKSDGSMTFVIGASFKKVLQYQLSTAWDISSASYQEPTTRYFDATSQDNIVTGLSFKTDGTRMYVLGHQNDSVYEYDLSTAWDASSASYSQSFSVTSQDTVPFDLVFKPDGAKMYVAGLSSDTILEYDLSTAWDISSASYNQNFDISSQDTSPGGLFFKPDGLKMYMSGNSSDSVHEYDLSTAWDVSTASFNQSFSVTSQESNPTGLFFKPDGLKMYVSGSGNDKINEYDLSTAWDISSASYLQQLNIVAQDDSSQGIFFKPDGLKMYMCGATTDSIYEYDL